MEKTPRPGPHSSLWKVSPLDMSLLHAGGKERRKKHGDGRTSCPMRPCNKPLRRFQLAGNGSFPRRPRGYLPQLMYALIRRLPGSTKRKVRDRSLVEGQQFFLSLSFLNMSESYDHGWLRTANRSSISGEEMWHALFWQENNWDDTRKVQGKTAWPIALLKGLDTISSHCGQYW